MKHYHAPAIELLRIPSADLLTVSLSGLDDGEPAPDDWFLQN